MTETPILNALLHPPLGVLKREVIAGTFSGGGDLTRPGPTAPFDKVNAYGLTWSFFTVPAPFGFQLGYPNVYEHRMVQLSTVHTDHAANDFISEVRSFHSEGFYWLWENPGPTKVHYEVQVGVAVVFYWLVFFFP